jgi:hypothetical protein
MNLYAVYPIRVHLPFRVRVFIDFIAEAINDQLSYPVFTSSR